MRLRRSRGSRLQPAIIHRSDSIPPVKSSTPNQPIIAIHPAHKKGMWSSYRCRRYWQANLAYNGVQAFIQKQLPIVLARPAVEAGANLVSSPRLADKCIRSSALYDASLFNRLLTRYQIAREAGSKWRPSRLCVVAHWRMHSLSWMKLRIPPANR